MFIIKNITAGYSDRNIIENLSFEFEAGKLYTIIGKNGCGKSTLLKSCANLIAVKSGEITVDGKNLCSYSPNERAKRISYLSQHRNISNITVEKLLMHGRHPYLSNIKKLRTEDWQVIDDALDAMDIKQYRHSIISSLSGGEQQRVYLAMILVQDTPIVLLDEPTTYMDIAYQLSIFNLIEKLKKQGKTLVMVHHDINQALQFSDHIILMDKGKIICDGSPEEIVKTDAVFKAFGVKIEKIQDNNRYIYSLQLA